MSHNERVEIKMRGYKIEELKGDNAALNAEILRLTGLLRGCGEVVDAVVKDMPIYGERPVEIDSDMQNKAQLLLDKLVKFREKPIESPG